MNRDYRIYLGWNNEEEGFRLPVNPETLEVKTNNEGKTYDILRLGEINAIQRPRLTEFNFSSVFPLQRYRLIEEDDVWFTPLTYVKWLEGWMKSRRPVRFIFTGANTVFRSEGERALVEINTPATIERFDWKESAGSPGDIEYELSLKKYVFYAARQVSVVTDASSNSVVEAMDAPRADDRVQPRTYEVKPGDSLWKIAQQQLGNGSRYRELQELNGIPDSQGGGLLRVGLIIRLPGGGASND